MRVLRRGLVRRVRVSSIRGVLSRVVSSRIFSIERTLVGVVGKRRPISGRAMQDFLCDLFFSSVRGRGKLVLGLLLIVFVTTILTRFTSIFKGKRTNDVDFCVICLTLFAVLVRGFSELKDALAG